MTRREIPGNYKKVYKSIISLTKKLSRVNTYNRSEVAKLKKDIEETPSLPQSERAWFMKQVEAL